jgi:para-nitrobenzyl esterase
MDRRIVLLAMGTLLSCTAAPAAPPAQDPLVARAGVAVVETQAGRVQGFIHRGIYTYRGIPYAQAARFMPPEAPARWDGVRTTLTYGHICPMTLPEELDDAGEFLGPHRYGLPADNCQNLNVWTPAIVSASASATAPGAGKPRPVMVWFHGGGFANGSSIEQVAYDGEALSREGDVVVVTVNHRLNVGGFLDLSAYGPQFRHSGNLGILDLVASLRWVHDNIARFGGDPGNVTVFGQSGGGGKVTTLLAAPAAKGLFHKAIIESGSMRGMGMTLVDQRTSRRVAELTLANLGIDGSQAAAAQGEDALLARLQKLPYGQLIEASNKALKAVGDEQGVRGLFGGGISWAPVLDGDYLPANPFDGAAPAQSADVPLMVGTTLNEFPLADFTPRTRGSRAWSDQQRADYFKEKYGDQAGAVAAAYRRAYPAMQPTDWLTVDSMFRPGALATAGLKADQHAAPVYLYLFSWVSPVLDGRGGAVHCAEIPFVFHNVAITEQSNGGGPGALAMQRKVSHAWINFARSGNPANPALPPWPAYTRANGATMVLDTDSEVRFHHDDELMSLLAGH